MAKGIQEYSFNQVPSWRLPLCVTVWYWLLFIAYLESKIKIGALDGGLPYDPARRR